jgi:hypothetical protein
VKEEKAMRYAKLWVCSAVALAVIWVFVTLAFAQDKKPEPPLTCGKDDPCISIVAPSVERKRLGKACVYYMSDNTFEITKPPCEYDKPAHSSWPCGDVAGEKCPYDSDPPEDQTVPYNPSMAIPHPKATWIQEPIPEGMVTGDPQWIGHWECPNGFKAIVHRDADSDHLSSAVCEKSKP